MTDDPYKYFRLEAREIAETLNAGFIELESGATPDLVQRLLRHAHTLKGAARVVRQPEIAEQAHAVEDALAPFRDGGGIIPRAIVSKLLAALDDIVARVVALDRPVVPTRRAAEAPAEEVRSVRAELAEMDALLDGVIETHGRLEAVREVAGELVLAWQLADVAIARAGSRGREQKDDPQLRGTLEQLRDLVRASERRLRGGLEHADRELGQVRDLAENLRLVPVGSLFGTLQRTARDVAHELGKEVELEGRGGEIRLDAPVIAAIGPALIQLVRNAVAHGIETPEVRRARNKPAKGRVVVEVARRARRIAFTCRDDGAGLDLAAVRRVAQQRGLVMPSSAPTAGELVELLLRGGLTTSRAVTEVAGRGIGLDIVREARARLGAQIDVRSDASGTVFELVVPASLAAVEGLLLEAGGTTVAMPLDAVRETTRVAATAIGRTATGETVMHGSRAVPFVWLPAALGKPTRARDGVVVIVEGQGELAALGVERMIGTATIVVRAIPDLVDVDPIVAGAWLDAAGNPRLVLDPDGVVACARTGKAVQPVHETRRISVLVIDDSLTTRMLEQSILESAGYEVDTAISAEQGLDAARAKRYALFLVDVEMPGMDGFQFIEHVRADPALRDTPAILVTSRASAEDRQRGMQVGANGYIVKSEFDQTDLLARIEKMVSR